MCCPVSRIIASLLPLDIACDSLQTPRPHSCTQPSQAAAAQIFAMFKLNSTNCAKKQKCILNVLIYFEPVLRWAQQPTAQHSFVGDLDTVKTGLSNIEATSEASKACNRR